MGIFLGFFKFFKHQKLKIDRLERIEFCLRAEILQYFCNFLAYFSSSGNIDKFTQRKFMIAKCLKIGPKHLMKSQRSSSYRTTKNVQWSVLRMFAMALNISNSCSKICLLSHLKEVKCPCVFFRVRRFLAIWSNVFGSYLALCNQNISEVEFSYIFNAHKNVEKINKICSSFIFQQESEPF